MKCYNKLKSLAHYDLNSNKKMEEVLDVMVDDVKILNKFIPIDKKCFLFCIFY